MVHIFDVDFTVLKNSSSWYFLREAIQTGVIRFSQIRRLPLEWIKYKLGRPNMDFIEESMKFLAGIDKLVLEQTAENCFCRRMRPNIYEDAASLIREALGRGEKVIFATSSFKTLIQPLENFFGIKDSVTSLLEFRDGKTSGRIIGSSVFGKKKKSAVEKWLFENKIPPESVCFYSDSYTDLPLLELCGKAITVNPDRFLVKEAKKQCWEILYFKKTIGK